MRATFGPSPSRSRPSKCAVRSATDPGCHGASSSFLLVRGLVRGAFEGGARSVPVLAQGLEADVVAAFFGRIVAKLVLQMVLVVRTDRIPTHTADFGAPTRRVGFH